MSILHSSSSDKEADTNLNVGNLNEKDEPSFDFDRLYSRGLQVTVTVTVTVTLPTSVRETPRLNLCHTGYYNFFLVVLSHFRKPLERYFE